MANNWHRSVCNILEAWMKFNKGLSEKTPVQMGIYFCRCYAFMSEHFLHRPQISPSFYQMRSKRMPECMWGNIFLYLGLLGQLLDDVKYHDP